MNDFKKALIDVAGDLSDSERSVKRALEGKHKRPSKRNFLVVPVFIMAVCLIGFTLWLLPNKVEQQASDMFKNDDLFDYYMATEKMFTSFDHESSEGKQWTINYAFRDYQTAIAIQAYAKAQGLTYTNEQYNKREQQLNALNHETENPFFEQLKELSGMTLEHYQTHVQPILIENVLYSSQLDEKWLAENPKLLEDFAREYTEKIVNDYLEENFERELLATKEYYNVTSDPNYGVSVPKSGTIAAVEGKMIYFIQNTTYHEIQQMTEEERHALQEERLKAWLINYDAVDVQVGDFVRVSVNRTNTSYNERITNGIAENLEVYIPVSKLAIPKIVVTDAQVEAWHQLTNELAWQAQEMVTNYLTPRYTVQLPEQTYTVFENDYNNYFIVPYGQATIGKLTQKQTKALDSWLQTFVTK
ncbi:hypothetical protein [Solibacillus sp.]|uniref:hypothetical protein n=1 Tax=Solibacillus sp. TaxID=1909654 RepID=UPI003314FD2A